MNSSNPAFVYLEDDAKSRKVMQLLLHNVLGFQNLTIFEDSTDFAEKIEALPDIPTIIFIDIQITPYDGFQILHRLKRDSRYQNTTFVALTASVMAHDVEQLKQEGFDGLIGKPLLSDVFPELVGKLLSGESIWYIP
jgi:two-component system cell cycle response regulator DivK